MPTYEYQCPAGHRFEKFQKITEKPRAKCPTCGKSATRQISAGAGLLFKGSGFYITDYGKSGKGPAKEETGKSSPEPQAAPKTESSAEAAPAKPEKPPKKVKE
jgi:putative FmdB family regulatory protein